MSEETEREKKTVRQCIVETLLSKHCFVTMYDGEIFVYVDGVYVRGIAEVLVQDAVEKVLGENATPWDKNEVLDSIKSRTFKDWEFWEVPKNLVCVANGVLNLETMQLEPHGCERHFLAKIPAHYLSRDEFGKIGCENRIDKFLHEVTADQADVDAIYEFFGYCLLRDMPFHKAIMLVGEGRNGKSTLLRLLRAFLGSENVAGISLQDLCQSRFAVAELLGKLANVYADLQQKSLWDTGMFKMLTGNDTVDAEVKYKQRRVKLTNSAKPIFSCNMMPINERDDTVAFWSRWILINFPNKFTKENGKVDEKLLEKLTTKEELSGLLLNVIEGLKRLLANGRFSNEKKLEETRRDYIMKSNPVQAFAEKRLECDLNAKTPKTEVYEAYKQFCDENKLPKVENNIFGRKLRTYVQFTDTQATIDGKHSINCYLGIKLKGEKTPTEQITLGTPT